MANQDPYFGRSEVSNSDLSWLQKHLIGDNSPSPIEAYKFGTLIDAIITEPHKVDYYQYTVEGEKYTAEQFKQAIQMKKAFDKDPLCANMLTMSEMQKVSIEPNFRIDYEGFKFSIPARCKWDLFAGNWGADIKSTEAKTQKQFNDAIHHFQYTRQRAWYMDIIGSDIDMLIGISKINFQVFKVPIKKDSEIYKIGKRQYQKLAFQYWTLF